MATQTMGQLYCGDAFGRKWNNAWGVCWRTQAGSLFDLSIEDLPQEPFEDLLSIVFYSVVDEYFSGKLPKKIADSCTVPERTDQKLGDVLQAARAGVS